MSTASLPSDDQTDEDFFDKLVDDEIEVSGSDNHSKVVEKDSKLESCSSLNEESSVVAKDEIESRGKGVKIVQWSSFNLDDESNGFESNLDFLNENSVGFDNAVISNDLVDNTKGIQCWEKTIDSKQNAAVNNNNAQCWENYVENQQNGDLYGTQYWGSGATTNDSNELENWENSYPGWKYDHNTGQWYQIENSISYGIPQAENYNIDNGNVMENISHGSTDQFTSNEKSKASYLQHSAKSNVGAIDFSHEEVNNGYPPNMVFDPQYPGWYYDTNTQQWYALESYNQTIQQMPYKVHEENNFNQYEQNGVQSVDDRYVQKNMWQSNNSVQSVSTVAENQQVGNFYSNSADNGPDYNDRNASFKMFQPTASNNFESDNSVNGFQSFVPKQNAYQFNQPNTQATLHDHLSNSYYDDYSQQPFQNTNASQSQFSCANESRSSAGRPPHALVTFGFGGKLIVMKESNTLGAKLGYDTQDIGNGTISVLNLMDVVVDKVDSSCDGYFNDLCRQSFPGPLVGGNAGAKEVNKWIDDKIQSHESLNIDMRKRGQLKLLLSLLKISCQHYGKLRSPFGGNSSLDGTNGPESDVTKIFTSSAYSRGCGLSTCCTQKFPSEGQILETAINVQKLLLSGKRKQALQCAQAGQLWGPALVLASQLGEKYYTQTVKQMAQHQFISGSPLRTLCLLIAGEPADVFSSNNSTEYNLSANGISPQLNKMCLDNMLNEWEENLAIITANRTKDDEFVIVHLGDCLWKERGEITAAHTCYLVAEANFDAYTDTARLCLIGADHWKYPRTYAYPEAIQRTEIYEYSKVLGNSQFVLVQFQPYKLVYAYMLAEVGKISDSLRYCQATLKLLKNSNHGPGVEMWKSRLSSFEERLKTHQQSGYSTNSTPSKLVGKLFTSIDKSISRMMGGPASPHPPKENHTLGGSQSTLAMSSLIPSASGEGINEWNGDNNRKNKHSRSASEPDFGSNSKQDSSKETSLSDAESKSASRFGRLGSQLLKTVGWMSRSHQAKLGESNKFYYDEKLKRWVEEGAQPPVEELAPPPPPTISSFNNGNSQYNINNAFKSPTDAVNGAPEVKSTSPGHSPGIPPLSPNPKQFSARGRMGVRSRYVDTFNKNSGNSVGPPVPKPFPTPPVPSLKPLSNAKFFIPTAPANTEEQKTDSNTNSENIQNSVQNEEPPSQSTFSGIQRVPSMNSILPYGNSAKSASSTSDKGSHPSHSRRASWSGEIHNPNLTKPLINGGNYGDLHEVAF